MEKQTDFLGTYFDRNGVLKLERWARMAAWGALAAYLLESGYNLYLSISGPLAGGYAFDWFTLLTTFSKMMQGVVLFVFLQVASKVLLILMDIEDNTRRAARTNSKAS